MSKNQGATKPPNYDYTTAERKRTLRQRKNRAYMIVKAIAQRAGYMNSPDDYNGLDKFLREFAVEGNEIDWFEAVDDL